MKEKEQGLVSSGDANPEQEYNKALVPGDKIALAKWSVK